MTKNLALSIHVQNACNSDCTFCIVDASIYKQYIPREEIEQVLDENEHLLPESVNFHGGEPTIRKDLVDIIQSVTARGLGTKEISVQTNGRKLADLEYTRTLIEAGVNLFVISLHGHTAAIQDETSRREGSFDTAVQGIRNARALGCKVRTNSVVAKNNVRHLVELVDLLAELDVNWINISALHTASEAVMTTFHDVVPRYTDVRPYLVKAVQRANDHGIPVILEGFPLCVYPEDIETHLHLGRMRSQKIRMYFRGSTIEDYDKYMDVRHRSRGGPCEGCALTSHCAGVYREYLAAHGWEEFGDSNQLHTRHVTHPNPIAAGRSGDAR